jgi:hypothetical protein
VDPRPAAATWIPAAFLVLAAAGGAAFQQVQQASGRAALYAEARRVAARARVGEGGPLLHTVSVVGDTGYATFVSAVGYDRFGQLRTESETLLWKRGPDGRWEGPMRPEAEPRGRR